MTQEAVENKSSSDYQANFQRLKETLGTDDFRTFVQGSEMLNISRGAGDALHLTHLFREILEEHSVELSITLSLDPDHPSLIGAYAYSPFLLFPVHDARTLDPSDKDYGLSSGKVNERITRLIAKFIDKANTDD